MEGWKEACIIGHCDTQRHHSYIRREEPSTMVYLNENRTGGGLLRLGKHHKTFHWSWSCENMLSPTDLSDFHHLTGHTYPRMQQPHLVQTGWVLPQCRPPIRREEIPAIFLIANFSKIGFRASSNGHFLSSQTSYELGIVPRSGFSGSKNTMMGSLGSRAAAKWPFANLKICRNTRRRSNRRVSRRRI